MGMATPFPEPDSPELERFAVRSEAEIVGLLRLVQERGVPLNAFVDAGLPLGMVMLLKIDDVAHALAFARLDDATVSGRALAGRPVTFVGFVDSIKVQFAASGVSMGAGGDAATFTVSIPAQFHRFQRRSAGRVRPKAGRSAVCRVPLPGGTGERETLRVLDVSTGGIAVLTHPERFEPMVGAEIDDCRLDLPGVGGAVVSLRVRHVGPKPGEEGVRCCGCAFVRMAPNVQSMLARYLGWLETPIG